MTSASDSHNLSLGIMTLSTNAMASEERTTDHFGQPPLRQRRRAMEVALIKLCHQNTRVRSSRDLKMLKNIQDPLIAPNILITEDNNPKIPNVIRRENDNCQIPLENFQEELRDPKLTNNNRILHLPRFPSLRIFSPYFPFIIILLITSLLLLSQLHMATSLSTKNSRNAKLQSPIPTTVSKAYTDIYSLNNPSSYNYNATLKNKKAKRHRNIRNKSLNTSPTSKYTFDDSNFTNNVNRRPFYTKITSSDAVSKPYFDADQTTTKKPRKSIDKPSKLYSTSTIMESATDKSFLSTTPGSFGSTSGIPGISIAGGSKIRLEPFFNILNTFQSLALGTSKEQKFSPSYQTITQSISESVKKTEAKNKNSKLKGKGTNGLRQRNREKDSPNNYLGPIPISLPKPVVPEIQDEVTPEPEPEDDIITSESLLKIKPGTLHPLDVLNVPMSTSMSLVPGPSMATTTKRIGMVMDDSEVSEVPENEEDGQEPKAEAFKSLEAITKPSHGPFDLGNIDNNEDTDKNADQNRQNDNFYYKESNPKRNRSRSRSKQKKRRFNKHSKSGIKLSAKFAEYFPGVTPDRPDGPESRERRLSPDFFKNFHDSDIDLQAEETVAESETRPSNDGANNDNNFQNFQEVQAPQNVNIPPGHTNQNQNPDPYLEEEEELNSNLGVGRPGPNYYPSNANSNSNPKTEDIDMVSKYPVSFSYNPNNPSMKFKDPSASLGVPPPPPPGRIRQRMPYPIQMPYPYPYPHHPHPNPKHRPNLHSYYDPHYHRYTGQSENFNLNHYPNGYANPGNNHNHPNHFNQFNHPKFESHYTGHTLPRITRPSPAPTQQIPYQPPAGSFHPYNKPPEATSDLKQQESSADSTYNHQSDHLEDNELGAGTNSNQKIGVMSPFDVFYKEYKVLTWAAFLVITALCLLALVVYLYVNNPPTEVVTAKGFFDLSPVNYLNTLMTSNPQLMKFLESLVETNEKGGGNGKHKRRKYRKEIKSQPGSMGAQIMAAISGNGKKDL